MRPSSLLFTTALVALFAVSTRAGDLAPTGRLRAAFLGTNPVQGRVDPKTGDISGPVADLIKELARRLNVPYTLIPAPDARSVIAHLKDGTADVGFLAYEEARAQEVDFAGGFALMFNSYVVPAASPLKSVADADRAGVQVGVVRGQTQEIYLSGHLKNARVKIFEVMPQQAELQRLLVSGELDAFGLNRQRAEEATAASQSQLRALTGSYVDVEQSFVVKKGDKESAAFINKFVDELRDSGFIKASIARAKLVGAGVAPRRAR